MCPLPNVCGISFGLERGRARKGDNVRYVHGSYVCYASLYGMVKLPHYFVVASTGGHIVSRPCIPRIATTNGERYVRPIFHT